MAASMAFPPAFSRSRATCVASGWLVAIAPLGAYTVDRPATVEGNQSVEVIEELCMFCANCFSVCPSLPISDPLNDGVSIWVGGKVSNARVAPKFSKLAIPFIPNNPPRWPEVVEAVTKIVNIYAENAKKHERMGEWIERIGWPRFFEVTGLPFTKYHIDNWRGARASLNASTHIRF